jgi:hypothetical protein
MLRQATVLLCKTGIVPVMLVHDALLLEVDNDDQIEQAKEIMRTVSRNIFDEFEIGADLDQRLINGARYQDKRPVAQQMWATIMGVLGDLKAIPKDMAA